MRPIGNAFFILYMGRKIKLEQYEAEQGKTVYAAYIEQEAVYIRKVLNGEGLGFWTAVTPGRQVEAERIGELIDAYADKQRSEERGQASLF